MCDDFKELGLVLNWRKRCENREQWGKVIKPVAGRIPKGELRSRGSRAFGRLRERSGQGVSEAPVVGTKEWVDLEEVTIEELTERHRMTVEERRELPFSCTQCGRQFSEPRYMQRHKCVTTRKKG